MTYCDIFFQVFRPIFYGGIVFATHYFLQEKYPDIPYTWWIGLVAMVFVYYFLRVIFEFIFGLQHIGGIDEHYLYDMANNKSIITAILYFDKSDERILTHFKTMLRYRRLRSKFVKFLGDYYLKELKGE